MSDETWVHVIVSSAETEFQVLDPNKMRPPRPPKPRPIRAAYVIALKILIILSRLL